MMPVTDSTLPTVDIYTPSVYAAMIEGATLWPIFLIISPMILIMLAALFILHRWKKKKRG